MKVAVYHQSCSTPDELESQLESIRQSLPKGHVPVAFFIDMECQTHTKGDVFHRAWDFVEQGNAEALYLATSLSEAPAAEVTTADGATGSPGPLLISTPAGNGDGIN